MATIWNPTPVTVTDDGLVSEVAGLTFAGREPLHQSQIDMLADLSQHILKHSELGRVPQFVALAYWLRSSALKRLCAELRVGDAAGFVRVPRGIALHLPPVNVDTIFVYSWAMSLLAGNANVVRLPRDLPLDTQRLLSAVHGIASAHGQADRNIFCNFPYAGDTDQALSKHADLRLIWGGDAKVYAVSKINIRPDGLSIGFPDRQSLAVLKTAAYRGASEADRDALAANFFNDVFWFDQMGCGSPRLLVWLGHPEDMAEDFYNRVGGAIARRSYSVPVSVSIEKFVLANISLANETSTAYRRYANGIDICRTASPLLALASRQPGGFLSDYVIDELPKLAEFMTRKMQTLCYFGFDHEELTSLAKVISGRGGYRIVPIGQALQFDPTWDGVNLFEHMTRRIVVR